MSYNVEYLDEAVDLMFFDGMTVQYAREEGMPGSGGADPRKASDGDVMMIDVRRAWEECEYLDDDHRQAILAFAMVGTKPLASLVTGVDEGELSRRREEGLELMAIWLNSTYLDRVEWAEELEELEAQRAADPYGYSH